MIGLNKELRQSGELVLAEGLSFPDQAKLVRAGRDGVPRSCLTGYYGLASLVDANELPA
jgi:hypothetical protein